MQDNGKVSYMWEGKNGTYWALVAYWIGSGYQYVERQVDKDTYDLFYL
jgi:hypothetical protein